MLTTIFFVSNLGTYVHLFCVFKSEEITKLRYNRFAGPHRLIEAYSALHLALNSDLRIYRIPFFLLDLLHPKQRESWVWVFHLYWAHNVAATLNQRPTGSVFVLSEHFSVPERRFVMSQMNIKLVCYAF